MGDLKEYELIVNELIEDINKAIIDDDFEFIVNSLIAIDNYLINDIEKDLYNHLKKTKDDVLKMLKEKLESWDYNYIMEEVYYTSYDDFQYDVNIVK